MKSHPILTRRREQLKVSCRLSAALIRKLVPYSARHTYGTYPMEKEPQYIRRRQVHGPRRFEINGTVVQIPPSPTRITFEYTGLSLAAPATFPVLLSPVIASM
jgi:hypothetical protein